MKLPLLIAATCLCFFNSCQTTPTAEPSPPPVVDTFEITPKPVFKKGAKKVELHLFGLIDDGSAPDELQMKLTEWSEIPITGGIKPRVESADTMNRAKQLRGVDTMAPIVFPTGQTYHAKQPRNFIAPGEDTPRDVGLSVTAKVTPVAGGKLSVKIDTKNVDVVMIEESSGGEWKPKLVEWRSKAGPVVIENGGGLILATREIIQQTEDKVPILGDVPLVGRLFRSEAENHYRRMVAVQVSLVD